MIRYIGAEIKGFRFVERHLLHKWKYHIDGSTHLQCVNGVFVLAKVEIEPCLEVKARSQLCLANSSEKRTSANDVVDVVFFGRVAFNSGTCI